MAIDRNVLYANLMGEVKVRFLAITKLLNEPLGFPPPITREFCFLQLRILCELIALSCLVAHGDITFLQPHKLGKSYSADEILDRMTKLRPHFYPSAVTAEMETLPGGQRNFKMTDVTPSPFPKEELIKLYGKTHKYLHRGSLKKLMSKDELIDMKLDVPEIIGWAQKMANLLSAHIISINDRQILFCTLATKESDKVQVSPAERPAPKS